VIDMSGDLIISIDADSGNIKRALEEHRDEFDKQLENMVRSLTDIAARWVTREAPRKTGNLKASTRKEFNGDSGHVYVSNSQATYFDCVVDGTRPHDIKPKNGQALYWPGASYPVKVVHHPGTKANPYLDKAFDKIGPDVDRVVERFYSWVVNV
jgi:Ser-tRNA(Ala) deacylase AlaX